MQISDLSMWDYRWYTKPLKRGDVGMRSLAKIRMDLDAEGRKDGRVSNSLKAFAPSQRLRLSKQRQETPRTDYLHQDTVSSLRQGRR